MLTEDKRGNRPSSQYTLVYDGQCEVCRRSVAWIHRWDAEGVIHTLPYQDPSIKERFPDVSPQAFERAIQLVGPDGDRKEGARAVEELLRVMPGARLTTPLFRIPGVRGVAERIYRTVARNRRRFGCGNHCESAG